MINKKTTVKNQQGFTLVEIIVGLIVLPLILYSIGLIINSTGALNDQSKDLTLTNGIAEEKIESLRSSGFLSMPADGTVIDFTSELPDSFTPPRQATYTVTDVNLSVKQVDVRIQYTVGSGSEEVNFSSYIGELGIGQ